MNKRRRKEITEINRILESAKDLLSEAAERLEMVKEDEQEAFDNLPEGIQVSERGQRIESNVGILEDALSGLDTAADDIDEAQDALLTAIEE